MYTVVNTNEYETLAWQYETKKEAKAKCLEIIIDCAEFASPDGKKSIAEHLRNGQIDSAMEIFISEFPTDRIHLFGPGTDTIDPDKIERQKDEFIVSQITLSDL